MKSVCTIAAAVLAAAVSTSCNDASSTCAGQVTFESLFPADGEVSTWATDSGEGGVLEQTGDKDELFVLINGDADAILLNSDDTFVRFGRKPYTDGTYKLELRVWQLGSPSTCKDVYDGFAEHSLYSSIEWQSVSAGDEARAGEAGSVYWYNARKCSYFVDAQSIRRADGETTTGAALQTALPLVRAVVTKIP